MKKKFRFSLLFFFVVPLDWMACHAVIRGYNLSGACVFCKATFFPQPLLPFLALSFKLTHFFNPCLQFFSHPKSVLKTCQLQGSLIKCLVNCSCHSFKADDSYSWRFPHTVCNSALLTSIEIVSAFIDLRLDVDYRGVYIYFYFHFSGAVL